MSEKGVIVEDALSGESVACYDAIETDNDSNGRIIQLVDQSQRKTGFVISSNTGRIRTVTTSDGMDFSTVPTGITSNALTVGDKTTLVVSARYYQTSVEDITITPIVLDSGNAAVGILSPRVIKGFRPTDGVYITDPFHVEDGSGKWNLTEILSWNVLGAYKVGVHVACGSTDGSINGQVDVYAKMITGPGAGGAGAATYPTDGAYGSVTTSGGGE